MLRYTGYALIVLAIVEVIDVCHTIHRNNSIKNPG